MKSTILYLMYLSLFLFLTDANSSDVKTDTGKFQFDIGFIASLARTNELLPDQISVPDYEYKDTNLILGFSYLKKITTNQFLGMGAELQSIDGRGLIVAKAIDYKYLLSNNWYVRGNMGAGRYNDRTPSYGYVAGLGACFIMNNLHFTLKFQFADHLERDKLHIDDLKLNTSSFTNVKSLIFTVGKTF